MVRYLSGLQRADELSGLAGTAPAYVLSRLVPSGPATVVVADARTMDRALRSTIYQYIKDGVFPKPVPLGPRAVGWLESDVTEWIAARVKIARAGGRPSA